MVLYGQQLGKRPRSAASLNVNKVTESVFEEADVVSKKQKRGGVNKAVLRVKHDQHHQDYHHLKSSNTDEVC